VANNNQSIFIGDEQNGDENEVFTENNHDDENKTVIDEINQEMDELYEKGQVYIICNHKTMIQFALYYL
jgi:hypothetical protein